HDRGIGQVAVRDPHLRAVQYPVLAVALRPRLHIPGVRTTLRLGQAETAYGFAPRHRRQPSLLLLFRTERVNRVHHKAALHRHETPEPAVASLQFLADQPVRDAVETGAVIALYGTAEQPEFRNLRNEFPWEVMVLEGLPNDRDDLRVDELADGILHHALFIGKL